MATKFRLSPKANLLILGVVIRILVGLIYTISPNSWEYLPLEYPYYPFAGADGHIQIAKTLITSGEYAFFEGGATVHHRPPITPLLMTLVAWNAKYWYILWQGINLAFFVGAFCFLRKALYNEDYLSQKSTYTNATSLEKSGVFQWMDVRFVALSIFTLHPFSIGAVRVTTFLTPATFIISVFLYLLVKPKKNRNTSILLGLVCGIAALTHGSLLILGLVALVLTLYDANLRRYAWLYFVGVLLVLSPWLVRNYIVFGSALPLTTGFGMQYWLKVADYTRDDGYENRIFFAETGRQLNVRYFGAVDIADENILFQLALYDALLYPIDFIKRALWGMVTFWVFTKDGALKASITALCNLPLIVGLFFAFRKKNLFPLLTLFGLWGVFAVFAGQNTYFTMILPIGAWLIGNSRLRF